MTTEELKTRIDFLVGKMPTVEEAKLLASIYIATIQANAIKEAAERIHDGLNAAAIIFSNR